MQIYIGREGQRFGPYSLEEINQQLAAGTIMPTDQAWSEGSPGWRALSSLPGVILPGGASSSPASVSSALSVVPAVPPDFDNLVRISWILLGVLSLASIIPIFGCAVWLFATPVLLTTLVLGIIVLTRGGTTPGILILVATVVVVPIIIIVVPLIIMAIIGEVGGSVSP